MSTVCMTTAVEIRVLGIPAPQGSKTAFISKSTGRAGMKEDCNRTEPWRESVAWAARAAGGRVAGAVTIDVVFTVPKPKSAPKRRRTLPDRKPDIDKLCRALLDSLVRAGTIEDDARVVRLTAAKAFPGEQAGAMDVPGALIRVEAAAR